MAEELDDITGETAAIMKTMLSLATLIALRTRERGQKEAEARVKITEARQKEARELQIREAREAKAKDPRNAELERMMKIPTPSVGLSLSKERGPENEVSRMATSSAAAAMPQIRYDSPERRTAIAAHLARIGVAPELAAVRMLVEVGQGASVEDAANARQKEAPRSGLTREEELARGLERTR
ncbi:hypothetical protein [Nocardia bovistercoris]|uniref:Uncharacterized protein n=1 Tax=Nocardia bovistercoris TaxID=2785916 RepID=A0A931I6U4_9NOCA|nr:hypothetical protein [Nocardia bovistercoris]MBH0774945.1 hypothetical protein [Nocardia bovistercoris]